MTNILEIDISKIKTNPFQPRRQFAEDELRELKNSIRHYGVLQPLLVTEAPLGTYTLVAGERRLRAAKLAGLKMVPCVVGEYDDRQKAEIALIENIQRANLNYLEEAAAMQRLLNEFGITQEELGQHLGKTQATIANKLRLLRLDGKIKDGLLQAGLSERHARALLRLSETQRPEALKHIAQYKLNVLQTDRYVEQLCQTVAPRPQRKALVSNVQIHVNTFKRMVDAMQKVGIETDYKHKLDGKDLVITVRIKNATR